MSNKIRYHILKNNLIEYRCSRCGNIGEWQGEELTLQLHHIDGNHQNNDLKNLIFLCPNCHSQTVSFSKPKKEAFINKEVFVNLIKNGKTLRGALLAMGLSDGGANYTTGYRILEEYGLQYDTKVVDDNRCIDCGCIITKEAKRCQKCNAMHQQMVKRPSKETLLNEISKNGFAATGRKYGVSDNAIRKWCRAYGLPTTIKEIKELAC